MKQLFATTAIALLTAGPVLAESHMMSTGGFVDSTKMQGSTQADLRASNLIGKRVYTVEGGTDVTFANETETDWDDLGEISDVILSRDGSMEAILVDVGGFLGLGEKTVMVTMDSVTVLRSDNGDDVRIDMDTTEDALEEMPAYEG